MLHDTIRAEYVIHTYPLGIGFGQYVTPPWYANHVCELSMFCVVPPMCDEFVDGMIGGHPVKILLKDNGNDQIIPLDVEEIE